MFRYLHPSIFPLFLLLSSCETPGWEYITTSDDTENRSYIYSREYVAQVIGYAVTTGRVLGVENLHSSSEELLADGVATVISKAGCHVTMQLGERRHDVILGAGCIVVYGRERDYILEPYELAGEDDAVKEAVLLEQVSLALDYIDDRSLPEAGQEIDRLTVLFPGNKSAELFQILLRSRLLRLKERLPGKHPSIPRNPAEAANALADAQVLLENKQHEDARLALERAYSLDPAHRNIGNKLASLLKKMGLELYSKGESDRAISCWMRVLEIRPGDVEALRFLQRAEMVRKKM